MRETRAAARHHSVVHLADYAATYSGTFIASLRALARACDDMGLRTAFGLSRICAGQGWTDSLKRDGFPVHFLDASMPLRDRTRAIGAIAAHENAAIVHAHFGVYDVPAALAAIRARRRYAVIWHRHNGFPPRRSLGAVVKDAVKLRVLGRTSWVLGVSRALTEEAVAHGFPPERAFRIDNAIDIARVTSPTASRELLRPSMGIPPEARVVLVFGWDPIRKGVDVALDAVGALASELPVVLLLVGGGAMQHFLRERCRAGAPPWLRTVHPREDVADLFAVSDVFLSASRDEGFSYALGEALANGLPCVVSDIPPVEWARDAGALFFPPDDLNALTLTLKDALRLSPERRDAIAHSARSFALANLSLDHWARRLTTVYELVLRDRGAALGALERRPAA